MRFHLPMMLFVFAMSPFAVPLAAQSATEQAEIPLASSGTDRDTAIFIALKNKVEIDYFETPLQDVLEDLSSKHKIQIVLNPSVADNNLNPKTLITLKLANVSLKSALRIMLGAFQCRLVVANEVLTIMSEKSADALFLSRRYDCRQLVEEIGGDSEINLAKLERVIKTSVDPESWDSRGGLGA